MIRNFLLVLILGSDLTASSQDVTITLTGSWPNPTVAVAGTSGQNANGSYKLPQATSFSIHIQPISPTDAYSIRLSNNATPVGNPLSLTPAAVGNKVVTIDGSGLVQAGSATIKVANSFTIFIKASSGSVSVAFAVVAGASTPSIGDYIPTGIPAFDAITLTNAGTDAGAHDTIMRIFSYYMSEDANKKLLTTWNTVAAGYPANSYVQDYVNARKTLTPDPAAVQGAQPPVDMVSSALSAVGGLDVTNIADGLAKFLVKRAKEELSTAFFTRFKEQISKYPDLQTVFPQTYKSLTLIDNEIYNFQSYLQTLRESFQKDLSALPSNLPTIITNHPDFFNRQPVLTGILKTAFYISQQIQGHQHPGYIIENYPATDIWAADANVMASFQTLTLLSTSLKNITDTVTYWMPLKTIQNLFNRSDELLSIYLGLLEQKARLAGISFKDAANVDHPLDAIIDGAHGVVNGLPQYKIFIKNVCLKTQTLEGQISALKKVTNDSLLIENYYNVVGGAIDLMKFLVTAQSLPAWPQNLGLQVNVDHYFNVAQLFSDIVVDINRKNYSSAIVNAVNVYDSLFTKSNLAAYYTSITANPPAPMVTAATNAANRAARGGIAGAASIATAVADSVAAANQGMADMANNMPTTLFKFGAFMAAMVQAKSSDDVESVIESFALPSGSARVKRESEMNISLNGYVGFYYGHETISGVKNSTYLNSYGITAPIGVALSWGHQFLFWPQGGWKEGKHGWSTSLFISVLDLGAIASYRVSNDSVQQVPTIQLKDIFSPGVFLSIGIPKSPMSFSVGGQFGPNLRKVTNTVNDYSGKTYFRLSMSLLVDIPVLNLYTKAKTD